MARLLIADRSLTARMTLKDMAESLGHDAAVAGGVSEIEMALSGRTEGQSPAFDLVLLDVDLPDRTGAAPLLRTFGELAGAQDLPIVLLQLENETADEGGRVVGRLTKPCDDDTLIQTLDAALLARPLIYIVDDSPTFRAELREALTEASYEVREFQTAEEILRHLEQGPRRADALVIDGILPGMDGRTLIGRIRGDQALWRLPCLLLTASDDRADEIRALEVGADTYVRKDEGMPLILTRLAAVLRHRRETLPKGGSGGAWSHWTGEARESLYAPKRVLAVDDSETYLRSLEQPLANEGYEILLARSGEEALDLLARESVHCILLDLVMPGLSGVETCRRIKEDPTFRAIPILMLTASEGRETMLESFNAGADDFISKASDFSVLKARLRAQLRRKQAEVETRVIRERLHQNDIEASEARATRKLADARAALLRDLEIKHSELEETNRGVVALYAELEEKARSLQQAYELKNRFISYISHEFRTPVTSLLSLSGLLLDHQDRELSPTQLKQIGYIRSAAETLSETVNDFLDLAKVESGKVAVRILEFDVGDVLTALRGLFRPLLAPGSGVTLLIEDPPPDFPRMRSDQGKVAQILRNLVSNAIKFTTEGSVRLTLSYDAATGIAQFSVVDTGIGLERDDLERIFEEFAQVENSLQEKFKGTGLGLPLSRNLAELLGGSLRARSDGPGKGSTFLAMLPARLAKEEGETAKSEAIVSLQRAGAAANDGRRSLFRSVSTSPPRKPVVLVIDDDEIARYALAALFEGASSDFVEASNGIAGLRLAQELTPAVIFLDLRMPGLTGFEVLERLRQNPATREIPVIIYSSEDIAPQVRARLEQDTLAVITKKDTSLRATARKIQETLQKAGLNLAREVSK